jgi:hypothetical protein
MGYILNEPKTFINIKLTDAGRRQLSLGALQFVSAVFSDREINYDIDRDTENYDISRNRILSPVDVQPRLLFNYDSTNAIPLAGNQLVSAKQFSTGATDSYGFFTGTTISSATTAIDTTKTLGNFNTFTYSTSPVNGGSSILLDNPGGSYFPNPGELVYIPWEPIQNSGKTYSGAVLLSGNPTVNLWYRVTATNGSDTIYLDRPTPDFGGESTSQVINTYFYPYNGVETYYGTASTINPMVWNMNIVRTQSVEGTPLSVSGYTSYGSIEYNGTKQLLGFRGDTSAVGILHFTNEYTGNTYAEQFLEKTVRVDLPNIMWHGTAADNGQGLSYGLTLYDSNGDTFSDTISNTTYRDLKDGVSDNSRVVGRVYHKLKLIVITDPELLTALSYKSNRNYTLPPLDVTLVNAPKYPLSTTQATGIATSGKTYFVTYITESNPTYTSGSTFGYPQALHCGYIQRIPGNTAADGQKQYISATFPTNGFPYLRNSANMSANSAYSGTGWNANKVQLLVNEVTADNFTSADAQLSDTKPYEWKLISTTVGNGIYTGDTTDLTVDASKLNSYQFIISQEDYDSGTTYVLDNVFTDNNDHTFTGLTFGDESFFFGNVKADVLATTFKTVITTFAANDSLNSSTNSSFDSTLDSDAYISEIGILDDNDNLVAVGKPTYPIKKNEGRFLTFQLQIDF